MRPSRSEARALAAAALAALAYLACAPPEPPQPPPAPPLTAAASASVATAPPPASHVFPRRHGRTLLADLPDTPLDFTLQPIPGGRAVLAVAQHAGEREAWARRIDATGAQGPLVRAADQYIAGAFDRPDGTTVYVTSDGARLCFRIPPAPPDDHACISANPVAIVPVADRLALLEVTTAHPVTPAATRPTHLAPRPKEVQPHAKSHSHHTTRSPKKRTSHAAASHRASHPLVELFIRWVDPTGVIASDPQPTGLHFEAPLDGMTLADARARPPGIDVLWYETAPGRKARTPLGSARLMAASLRADGTLDFASRVAVADADAEYGQLKDHHAPRLAGTDDATVFLDLDARGSCEAVRVLPTLAHLAPPPAAACALAPDRLAFPVEPAALAAFEHILADDPRSTFAQPRTDIGLAAWAGDRAFYLHDGALRSATLTAGPPRDEPAPFPAHRARIAWGSFAPDGEAMAFAGGSLLHLAAHIERVPLPADDVVNASPAQQLSSPELPADRRRAARIAGTWWTARGPRLRLWPTFGATIPHPHHDDDDATVLTGGRDHGLSLDLAASALRLAAVGPAGDATPLPPLVPSPIRVGFDACERAAGGALVAGVSASDPAQVVAFTLDTGGRPGPAHRVPLPIRAGDLAVRLVPLPDGGALLTDLDRRHVVWISDDALPLAGAPWPPAASDAACLDGRPLPLSVPSPIPGQFVPVDDAATGSCIVGDPVWATDGTLRWFGGTADALDFAAEVATLRPLSLPASPAITPSPAPPPGPVAHPPQPCPADMVSIAGRFCVDRFEAMIVDARTGAPLSPDYPTTPGLLDFALAEWTTARERTGNVHARAFPLPWISRSRLGDKPQPLAVSRLGARPSGYLTGVVAEAACTAAGKRLCTLDEYVTACRGEDDTLFPYGDTYEDGTCNVFREEHPAAVLHGNASVGHLDPRLNRVTSKGHPLLQRTGASPACRSRWGDDAVYDMVGNLDEWVEEGNGAFAGGFYSRSTRSGCEALVTAHPKAYLDYSTGVRCCRDKMNPP